MRYVITLLLLCSGVIAGEKEPSVIFPMSATASVDPITPLPIKEVRPDRLYVVRTNDAQIFRHVSMGGTLTFEDLRASLPDGADRDAPLILRGVFADSDGTPSTKIFTEKYVYLVNGGKPGTVELLVIPKGVSEESDIVQQTMVVMGQGPQPPPKPDPKPEPPPSPVVAEKVSISVVEDVLHRSVETSMVLQDLVYWSSLVDSGNDWRLYDVATKEPKGLEAILQGGDLPPPFVIVRDKKTEKVIHKGALPKTMDDMKKLVSTLTGGK